DERFDLVAAQQMQLVVRPHDLKREPVLVEQHAVNRLAAFQLHMHRLIIVHGRQVRYVVTAIHVNVMLLLGEGGNDVGGFTDSGDVRQVRSNQAAFAVN